MITVALLLALVILLLAAWLRAAGSAVTRLARADALRDAAEGVAGAEAVAEILDDRDAITPAVGVMVSALLVIAAVLSTAALGDGDPLSAALWEGMAAGALVFLLGDLIPRQIGRRQPRPIAYVSAGLLDVAVAIGGWANDLLPEHEAGEDVRPEVDEEDEETERELITSVLEFGDTIVREVMTPRPDMTTVPVDATLEELVEIASREGYSRVPVTSGDDVVGIVIVKDLLPVLADGVRPTSVGGIMRPAEFVPETKRVSALLAEMQASHVHQVIVVDEYGDVVGLVTIEDLLEEIVGEIADETDDEERLIAVRGDGSWEVDARLSIEALVRAIGVELPGDDWDTVGGLVMGLAERVPEEGEEFECGPLRLEVARMQGRRVADVIVTKTVEAPSA